MEQLKKTLIKIGIAAILVLGVVVLTVSFVQALFSKNPTAGTTGDGFTISGNSVEEKVWNSLISAGYSPIAAAGVMGNIYQESRFNPDLHQSGGNAYGLLQWKKRKKAYLAYASSKGVSSSDVDTQIEFMLAEMSLNGGADGYATCQFIPKSSRDKFMNASTPEEAATIFCKTWERAGTPRMNVRTEWARKYYEAYNK